VKQSQEHTLTALFNGITLLALAPEITSIARDVVLPSLSGWR